MNNGLAEFNFHLMKGEKEKKKFVKRVTAKNMPPQGPLCLCGPVCSSRFLREAENSLS
jgi:hypothetical protein